MSAQGATLGRGTVHLPVRPIAVLVAVAVAAVLTVSLFDDVRPETSVTSVAVEDRFAATSAALREAGVIGPAAPTIDPAVLESSNASVREQGASIAAVSATSLEGTGSPDDPASPIRRNRPIEFNGTACHQCR